ncbi:phosphate acetyltransferase [Saccharobesus litoralis]|uniref:Phosphate acetyltransferase n=1 Tax=Saccharobesus litoralis TaxID=2172099 RepID=A0A2S0VVH0_9ALTE|nr:phosphate acetyltransferase [Saccharobesus litoralis]AWB68224.1 phosphate acetyltransferase [Saccharobesus litoralis]
MSHAIMLVPVGMDVGLTSVSMGLVRAMEQQGLNVGFFKPIAQPRDDDAGPEKSTAIINASGVVKTAQPFDILQAEQWLSSGNDDELLEQIVGRYESQFQGNELVVLEGLVHTRGQAYASRINRLIATALGADVIFVAAPNEHSYCHLQDMIDIAIGNYGGVGAEHVLGCVFNKVGMPDDQQGRLALDNSAKTKAQAREKYQQVSQTIRELPLFKNKGLPILATIGWQFDLVAPRVKDLLASLPVEVLNQGDMEYRRLRSINFCARTVANMVTHFNANTLLVTPGDRNDVIVAACLAAMNGTKIGAILLTGGIKPQPEIMSLCDQALQAGLPLLLTELDTWQTAINLQQFNFEVPIDDEQRIEKVNNHLASCFDKNWLQGLANKSGLQRNKLSPAAFRYLLTERARQASKTIVLPEGNEPRTIKAAAICGKRGIARCVLLGDQQEIERIALQQGVELNGYVDIVDPQAIADDYIQALVDARQHKGMTPELASQQLQDNVMLGTMMLAANKVDGLVSGAVHSTADTIRPPLQIVKTAKDASLVSSIFFMLLPDQVLVYGDCAINPDPSAEQLADIAIQSADSAAAFGIQPKVAMVSYSTGSSGAGADVEKVALATHLAQQKRPDLTIDGPLQYDAAVMPSVAAKKAPDSQVAGQANVLVFPDLNTGNTTYKAVQRSANLVSIGPMLQGIAKPVNDLSRGALVDDIVYTIALTAIQATQG